MFWSAALDLKTQRLPPRPSYGSFNRFHVPQSIPEHQPLSQFTSPVPTDARRIDEYYERPDIAFARAQASQELSNHTQTALKLLLQRERSAKSKSSKIADMSSLSKLSNYNSQAKEAPELRKALAFAPDQHEANPQESSNEHNYWMQELERRRAGLKRSRRRTCTPLGERATTSPFKVGVIMCSVPLVLVLGFTLYVLLLGDGSSVSSNLISNMLGFGDQDTEALAARHDDMENKRGRIIALLAPLPEQTQFRKEYPMQSLSVPTVGQTRLRGSHE